MRHQLAAFILAVVLLAALLFLIYGEGFFAPDALGVRIMECYRAGDEQCFKDLAHVMLKDAGVAEILAALAAQEEQGQSDFFFACHTFTHQIGRLAYQHTQSIPRVYQECTEVCEGGCYHGAVEGYFSEHKLSLFPEHREKLSRALAQLCEQSLGPREVYYQCFHGIGHALMFIADQDPFGSLEACDLIKEERERNFCYTGVFMEHNNALKPGSSHPSLFTRPDDPLYPCNILKEQHLPMCYILSAQRFHVLKRNWPDALAMCQLVPTPFRKECSFGMGIELSTGGGRDTEEIVQGCRKVEEAVQRTYCQKGAVRGLFYRYAGNPPYALTLADRLCKAADPADRSMCYKEIGAQLAGWISDRGELSKRCDALGPDPSLWCKEGLQRDN